MPLRDRKRLEALKNADLAMYKLWKQSEVYSDESVAINRFQRQFIHPAIDALEAKYRKSAAQAQQDSPGAEVSNERG